MEAMMKQATEEELEGLENGYRELKIGERVRGKMKARNRGNARGGGRYPWVDIVVDSSDVYDPYRHIILCVEAE